MAKYGKKGMLDPLDLRRQGLDKRTAKNIADMGNFGLSKSTWSNYSTARKMLEKCKRETGREMEIPLGQGDTLAFIDWLDRERKVKHGTICSYLAGIRQIHILEGYSSTKIRTELVNLVLAGKQNKETLEKKTRKEDRLPVTLVVMKLIKATLRESKLSNYEKILTWTVCCLCFNGAFRIHEILCKEKWKYDKRFTLLGKDIKLVEEKKGKSMIIVNVKWPKEEKKGKDVEVELYETGTDICPVRALRKFWKQRKTENEELPAFRMEDGMAFTGQMLNATLKSLLKDHLDYNEGKFSSHSFRIGITSTMGQKGWSEEQLKEIGRWSSRAYEFYLKLPRTTRRPAAKGIGNL